jgi:hypothetical protein
VAAYLSHYYEPAFYLGAGLLSCFQQRTFKGKRERLRPNQQIASGLTYSLPQLASPTPDPRLSACRTTHPRPHLISGPAPATC